jgi:general secretion pathway protein D
MKTTTLVLILFLTAHGLWAQTPLAPMTPAQARLLQLRLNAATNNPAATPSASPGIPGLPTSPAAAPGAPATPGMPATTPAGLTPPPAMPAPDNAAAPAQETAGYTFTYEGVDVSQVLDVYADMVGRTLIRGVLPPASIILKTQSPLTKTEAIEALQAVLAINGISVVNIGDKFAKVGQSGDAATFGAKLDSTDAAHLPDMGSFVTHIVQLNYVKPSAMMPVISPFAKLNSIIPLDDNGILVIRDYAENVKRMLEMIQQVDVNVPAVIISEVIPIRYAMADDIANALNSLGGSGGGTVAIGNSTSAAPISGVAGNRATGTGLGGMGGTYQSGGINSGGINQPRTTLGTQATTTPNGTPTAGTTFQQRLQNIINRASSPTGGGGQQQIQIFGQAKIIADQRSNSLLIFATRQDMEMIKGVIKQLDVLLAQVLIEAVIMDYSLGPNTFDFGVSAVQNPTTLNPSGSVIGGGGVNNGQSFMHFLKTVTTTTGTNGLISSITSAITSSGSTNGGSFASGLPGGLSYFGSIGPTWDVALSAAAADSHASIIQRPRIQTSQAKPAQFFVGDTVPYVTSTYNYGGINGNQSSYSQLSVGVELDVTPFINPDGLVVMDIQQEIDDLNGTTAIAGVGDVPNTIKRTLNTEIAVRNQDTVMLGGFIKNKKSTSRSGVPFLQDIPLLGNLFTKRSDSKAREELIVLMRPTVLKTPEIAAINTIKEEQRLPGISAAAAEEVAAEQKLVEAERKKELKHPKTMRGGFYNAPMPTNAPEEQLPQPQAQGDGFFNTPPPVTPLNTNTDASLNPQ